MVSVRFMGFLSTVLLLVGALTVGDALHVAFVEQSVAVTSLDFLGSVVVGTVILLLGYRARKPVAEAYDLTSGSDEEEETTPPAGPSEAPRADDPEAEFDPEMSPLGDADPSERDGNS